MGNGTLNILQRLSFERHDDRTLLRRCIEWRGGTLFVLTLSHR